MDRRKQAKKYYKPKSWETLILALLIALILRATVIEAFNIPSGSMEDTLLIGDFLLGEKITYRFRMPRRGEVIIFKHPEPRFRGKDLIKRCVAVAGDTVQIINKVLYVNGKPVPDPPLAKHDSTFIPRRDNFGPYVVPPNCVFAMGDNRDNSYDSRFWGPVPRKNLKARPLFLYFSVDPGPGRHNFRTTLDAYKMFFKAVFHIPPRIRFKRIGMIIR
ncbi:signal peptidase I [bacterium]|nr:signal peptidase I [bacterium]RKZ33186.1 MAG: signal peptidase I [bacterium]